MLPDPGLPAWLHATYREPPFRAAERARRRIALDGPADEIGATHPPLRHRVELLERAGELPAEGFAIRSRGRSPPWTWS